MISKEQALKALEVVMEINHDSSPCNMMFNYSGHVESMSIGVYPYGWDNDSERWYSFTFRTLSGIDSGYASIWDGEYLPMEKEPRFDTLDEMLTVIKGVAMEGMKDGQTQ